MKRRVVEMSVVYLCIACIYTNNHGRKLWEKTWIAQENSTLLMIAKLQLCEE